MDDDPGILYLLEKLLNQMRLSVVTAADAETALSLFEKDASGSRHYGSKTAGYTGHRLCPPCAETFSPDADHSLQQLFGHA